MVAKPASTLPGKIFSRIEGSDGKVWTPSDFSDLGSGGAVSVALQRMVNKGRIRRVSRGLYFLPGIIRLTGQEAPPLEKDVIEAVTRRVRGRWVLDGLAAANLAGMTNLVPSKLVVLVDARLKTVKLGNLKFVFQQAAPSRLFWAGRPGMCHVQGLYWSRDLMDYDFETRRLSRIIRRHLTDEEYGAELTEDLISGLPAMPAWMQDFLRKPLASAQAGWMQ